MAVSSAVCTVPNIVKISSTFNCKGLGLGCYPNWIQEFIRFGEALKKEFICIEHVAGASALILKMGCTAQCIAKTACSDRPSLSSSIGFFVL